MICAHRGEDNQCLNPRKVDIAKWCTLMHDILAHYDKYTDLNGVRITISHCFKPLNSSSILCSLLKSSFAFFSCLDQQAQLFNFISASVIHTHTLLIYTALICIIEMPMMRKWFDSILLCLLWFILACWEKSFYLLPWEWFFFFHSTDSTDDDQSNLDTRIHFKCRESEPLLQSNKQPWSALQF